MACIKYNGVNPLNLALKNDPITLIRERSNEQLQIILIDILDRDTDMKIQYVLKEHLDNFQAVDVSKYLLLAAKLGHVKMAQILLDSKYNINVLHSPTRSTPLMVAIAYRQEILIEMLLSAGADLTMQDHEGKSALNMICEEPYFPASIRRQVARQLREQISCSEKIAETLADSNSDLLQAAYLGDPRVFEYILKRNEYSVDSENAITKQTSMHISVAENHVELVKLLLKYKANVNALDALGSTPICYLYRTKSEAWEKIEILKALLDSKVSLTSCDFDGCFHVGPVLLYGNFEEIRLVLESDIDFLARDRSNEQSILHYLAMNTNPGIVEELKLYINKFNLNAVDRTNMSPLNVSMEYSNLNMAFFLLDHNVNSNLAHSEFGYTPLYYAYAKFKSGFKNQWSNERDRCVELLLQNNSDPQFIVTEEITNEQITVFDAAIKANNFDKLDQVIAHLAILEGIGVSITKTTSDKISRYPWLNKYFNRCQKFIRKKISGSVTLLQLLSSDEKTIIRYSRSKKLLLRLIRLNCKSKVKLVYSYYYKVLKKRIFKANWSRRYRNEVADVLCEIFDHRCDKTHLVVKLMKKKFGKL